MTVTHSIEMVISHDKESKILALPTVWSASTTTSLLYFIHLAISMPKKAGLALHNGNK
jgi:hypothetical protein